MKITKTQLKQIIKEELKRTLNEMQSGLPPWTGEFLKKLKSDYGSSIATYGFEGMRQKITEDVVFTLLQDKKSPYYLGGDGGTESSDKLKPIRTAVQKYVMSELEKLAGM